MKLKEYIQDHQMLNLYEIRERQNFGELRKENYRTAYVRATTKRKAVNKCAKQWGTKLYYDYTNYANVVVIEWKRG